MDVYYERVNQRYRGPFEQEKLAFLFNQIKMNITALYKACDDQKAQINNLPKINETQGFDFTFEDDPSDNYNAFESNFRNNFDTSAKASLSQKEKLRDIVTEVDDFIEEINKTF